MENMKFTILKELMDNRLIFISEKADRSDWFTLKSGDKTPIFFITHKLNSHPRIMKKIVAYTTALIKENNIAFDSIVGASYGGILYSMWVSYELNKPCLCIRKEGKKDYDDEGEILGVINKGERCLLFEDATVTGSSSLDFVKILDKYDAKVSGIITLIDAGFGAREVFAEKGIEFHGLFSWKEICDEYVKYNNAGGFIYDYMKLLDEKRVEINVVTQQIVWQQSMQLFGREDMLLLDETALNFSIE